MAFERQGSLYWSSEPNHPYYDWKAQGVNLATAVAAGALAFNAITTNRPDGTRIIDDIAHYTRTAGNMSPFQIGNTFRVPEFLSPFTSGEYQKLVGGAMNVSADYLKSAETFYYLKALTNKSVEELADLGITPGMIQGTKPLASDLFYYRDPKNRFTGSLFSVVNGSPKLLRENVALMAMSAETPGIAELSLKSRPVNKAVKSVLQVMDMWGEKGFANFKEWKLFTKAKGLTDVARPDFMFVPGSLGTYGRAVTAFSMERFNTLLSNSAENIFGPSVTLAMKNLGLGLDVKPGPASHMFSRFGLRSAALIGGGIAIAQTDWLRRQGLVPQVAVSAGISFGLATVLSKAGMKGKSSFFAGLAAFTGQMILPGFDQGIIPGIASTYVNTNQLLSSDINPINYYRRSLEGFLPGISSVGFGAFAGTSAVLLSHVKLPGTGDYLTNYLMNHNLTGGFGPAEYTAGGMHVQSPKSIKDLMYDQMFRYGEREIGTPEILDLVDEWKRRGSHSTFAMRNKFLHNLTNHMGPAKLSREMNRMWAVAEDRHSKLEAVNPVNTALVEKLQKIAEKYNGKSDLASRLSMQAEGIGEQFRHAFFGAHIHEKNTLSAIKNLGFKSPIGRVGLLFGTVLLGQQLATGGLFGTMQTYEELEGKYSGRTPVLIEQGRGFELGGTPFGGSDTGILRPHWYPIMMNRVVQAGVWGENEDKYSPLYKFYLSNFTHYLEDKNYYDRPYPISTPAFGNLPIIGAPLGATVGQLFKPSRLMHSGEWIRQGESGGLEFASVYEGWKREPAYNLGAYQPGIPTSPYALKPVVSELSYQFNELSGLTGFVTNTVSNLIFGTDILFPDQPRLAESGMMTSYRRGFWDMAIGGGGPIGEIVRRVVPSFTKDYEKNNPIPNNMPSWVPTLLRFGDPYARSPFGEASMPGAGYARLHPEVRGLDPEDYPLIHRYNILSQISPLSNEFRETRDALYMQRALGYLNPNQERWIDDIDKAVSNKWNIYEFQNVNRNAIQLPGSGLTQQVWDSTLRGARKIAAPIEYGLSPMAPKPFQKFLGNRDPIERYEYERMYGTPVAFWDQPYRDWIRPTMYSLANLMGYQQKPLWRIDADNTNQYFDQTEFYKWMSLAEQAALSGNKRDKIRYEYLASNTRMGVNPNGNPLSIYWSLPNEERAFFNSFSMAQGTDRDRILEMIPGDQKHLYKAIWSRLDKGDPTLWPGGNTDPNESYLFHQYKAMQEESLPPLDWIGYNKDVDIRDIKVRYVNELGRDMRDYGLWEQELKKAYAQPYLEGSTDSLPNTRYLGRGAILHNAGEVLHSGAAAPDITVQSIAGANSFIQLEYDDRRESEIMRMLREQVYAL